MLSIKFTNHALEGVPIDDASSYNIIYNDKLEQLGLQQPYINSFCGTDLLVFNDFITRPCKTIDQALPLGEGACEREVIINFFVISYGSASKVFGGDPSWKN